MQPKFNGHARTKIEGHASIAAVQAQTTAGIKLHQAGLFSEASTIYSNILKEDSANFQVVYLLGLIALQTQDFKSACELIGKAISFDPKNAGYHLNLGNALKGSGQFEAAIASYDKAIKIRPGDAAVYSNRGIALKELKQFELAISSFNLAISIKPDYAEAYSNQGNVLQQLQRFDDAIESYDKAISIKPDYHEAYSNRGNSLRESDRLELAIASCNKAIALKPDFAEAYSNLGNALFESKQLEAALASHNAAIMLNPASARAYSNRGNVLVELKQLDAAIADYDKAISIEPESVEFHLNKSFAHLLSGELEKGWKAYEWRLADPAFIARQPDRPRWSGQRPLQGQTVLIHSEQGLGDVLQFCRYAKLVEDSGARVLLEVPRHLRGLLQELAGVSELLAEGNPRPAFDLQCPLLSLPMAFATTLENVPRPESYLSPRDDLLAKWTSHIGKEGFKIGISWQGSTGKSAAGRSFPVQLFHRISKIPGVRLISLQKNAGVEQLAGLPADFVIETLPEDFDSSADAFLDSAAVMKSLDLMITGDTALGHLAGALGVPTWLALKFVPHWPWMLDRNDSPWYPNHRLFRQKMSGAWDSVFDEMASALSALPGMNDEARTV